MFQDTQVDQEGGMFLELGLNRLARDLFLLVAVYALFIVMFLGAVFRISASNSWLQEGQLVEDASTAPKGLLLSLHLRKDGRIGVGDSLCDTLEQARMTLEDMLQETPNLKEARVILNTWHRTPSVLTSDVVRVLTEAGLKADRVTLRFTEE